jgi:DNA invertase Pin-like site-specific DNA recombinase
MTENIIEPKKVALYCRVSNSEQTVENQKLRLMQYCLDRKIKKFDVYEETESARKTRPVKQALLQKLRNKEYDAVIVYKLDRWARSSTELILDCKELIDNGIGFISLSENLNFNTTSGKLYFPILSAIAEFEHERQTRGNQLKKKKEYISQ